MEHQPKKPKTSTFDMSIDSKLDLDSLLHPAKAFAHPMDVARDPDLTLNEKRAILASWASDACAVEAAPELRVNAAGKLVRWDDIMDALRMLDKGSGKLSAAVPGHEVAVRARMAKRTGARARSWLPAELRRRYARRSRISVEGTAWLRVGSVRFGASQR